MKPKLFKIGIWLIMSGLVIISVTIWLGFMWAPSVSSDAFNDPYAQKIFYWHVPAAWASFIAFALLFVGSLMWFWKRSEWGWHLHSSAAELGAIFGLMVITSGPIWASAEWGTPWDWTDVKLNTYAVLTGLALFLVITRKTQPDGIETRDTLSAMGLFGFVLVPLTFFASRIWKQRHPGGLVETEGAIHPDMMQVLLIGWFGFTLLLIGQIILLFEASKLELKLEKLQQRLD